MAQCDHDCPCSCHWRSRDVRLVPALLRPWIGQLSVPRTLPAAIWPSLSVCDHAGCAHSLQRIQKIKYCAPIWLARVQATIQFEAFPVHFCIETPRVVPSLLSLENITCDEFKIKLSTRELTLQDVEPDGFSVLHVSHKSFGRAQQ